jgi:hypothetical protein
MGLGRGETGRGGGNETATSWNLTVKVFVADDDKLFSKLRERRTCDKKRHNKFEIKL